MIIAPIVGAIVLALAIFGGYKLIERDQNQIDPPKMMEHQ